MMPGPPFSKTACSDHMQLIVGENDEHRSVISANAFAVRAAHGRAGLVSKRRIGIPVAQINIFNCL